MKKVKAFTVMEIMTVMLLTAIVIGAAYSGVSLFFKEYLIFQKRSVDNSGISLMDRLLVQDFETSKLVSAEGEKLVFYKKDKTVQYKFDPSYVLRKDSLVSDTFRIDLAQVEFFKSDVKISNGMIDELRLKAEYQGRALNFVHRKEYDAAFLMNQVNNY